jgi:CzcA family heavy metal efflux pump
MVNFLIRWSLANRFAVVLVSAILLVAGGYVTSTMPVDVFPSLTAPRVTVIVEGQGMAPEQMERQVTFPIETAVNGANNVRRVRSATAVGASVVWVEFEWGTDIHTARQIVNERLSTVEGNLPPEVESPHLAPISSIMGEVMFISLTSDQHEPMKLRTISETTIRRRLLAVSGVSQVSAIGGEKRQYQVVAKPEKLRAYDLGLSAIGGAVRQSNENVSAGFLTRGGRESVIQGEGRIQDLKDIRRTVVATRDDQPVHVSDVAEVQIGHAIRRGTAASSTRTEDWKPITRRGVVMAIKKQPNANTLELTERLDTVLNDIEAGLPEGMQINKNLFRQSRFIDAAIENTVTALLEGGAFVVLVVVVFLVSWRASTITLLAIPLSLVVTVLTLKAFGATINTMTLGGMAISIGALVDDAIIDVENVVRRLRENAALPSEQKRSIFNVIYHASVEVRTSIVFATFIILLVFSPLLFLSGVEGRLLRPLGIAFSVSLAASLVVALTITPALCYYLLPNSKTVRHAKEPMVVRFAKWLYDRPLRSALRRPWFYVTPTIVLMLGALAAVPMMGRNFLPEFNEGALVVGLVTEPGTSLERSDELAMRVQRTLMQQPEVAAIGRRTGRAEGTQHIQGVEASEIDLTLDMDAPERLGMETRTKEELLAALREDLSTISGIQATFGQPISHRIDHMLSGTRANIAVKIFGPDLQTLQDVADRVEAQMSGVDGVVDLSQQQQAQIPTTRVRFDRQALARYGLQVEDATRALRAGFRGNRVTQVLEGQVAFNVVVRVAGASRDDLSSIRTIPIDSPVAGKVPLKAVASIHEDIGPNFISREDVQRKMVVMCNVADRDLMSVVGDIRQNIDSNVDMPTGYHLEFGGQFESATAANRRLSILGIAVVIGIGFLLHIVFRSGRDALLIMVNLPLALIGGVVGVFVAGGVLSVASLIGFITVFGIAVRNGILMVSHIRHLQLYEGVTDFTEAVRRGAMERVAPILMTALASGLALVPLALRGNEPGTEILTPMAIVILFGLISSTFLNMIVVPALYVRFSRPPVAPAPGEQEPMTQNTQGA